MVKQICLKPRINKKNGQISFSLKKNSLPKNLKQKLPDLKGIELNWESFKW